MRINIPTSLIFKNFNLLGTVALDTALNRSDPYNPILQM